jgi:hypothetical protein
MIQNYLEIMKTNQKKIRKKDTWETSNLQARGKKLKEHPQMKINICLAKA